MEKRNYRKLDEFYRDKFGCKVFKVSIDASFSCPNKDGFKGKGGCIFCSGSTLVGERRDSIREQFDKTVDVLHKKWPEAKYIVFFEANTNTYGDIETLRKIYEYVLSFEGVVGLAIATRCDSITEEVYDYLEELNKRTYLSIELGLQSAHDATLKMINRGHTREDFTRCVSKLRQRNIEVVVHIINGLPNEDEEMMLETIEYINELDVQGIKFHMLYIEEGTVLAGMYNKNPFPLLSKEEYVRVLGKQLSILDERIVVHRLLSGPNNKKLIEPKWLLGKFVNLNYIEKYLSQNGIFQGKKK